MQKNKSDVARRAWRILRLALLWTRKGGVFRRRIAMELNLFPRLIKNLATTRRRDAVGYGGERELSFDKTPVIHVKMHRPSSMRFRMPHIPCINPEVEFDFDDYEFNDDDRVSYCNDDECCDEIGGCEDGIDLRAEQFIADFYEQLKMQRQQISYLK